MISFIINCLQLQEVGDFYHKCVCEAKNCQFLIGLVAGWIIP